MIDAALGLALRREFFTPDEACELLAGVQNKVHADARERQLAETIAAAEDTFARSVLVAQSRIVDTLLDLRLIVAR